MAEGNSTSEEVKAEDKEGHLGDDKREQAFVLLRVTQGNGTPLPVGGFTSGVMAQMLYEITGVTPRDVVILTDQEVVIELEKEIAREKQKELEWEHQQMKEDQHECQQQMMEILEKASDHIKR